MSLFVIRHVALTFEDEAHCAAFHKRIREMFLRHSSHPWTYDETEKITLDSVGDDEADWHDQLGYVFKGRSEEERLVRIWTMGHDDAKVKLSFKDMFEPDPRTQLIVGEEACWGPELFSCFRQYLEGDFGLERVKILLWSEDYRAEVWCEDCDGLYFYNKIDADSFYAKREELAEEQELEDASDTDDVEVLEETGLLEKSDEYESYCDELDDINMDEYPVFYDIETKVSAGESETSVPDVPPAGAKNRMTKRVPRPIRRGRGSASSAVPGSSRGARFARSAARALTTLLFVPTANARSTFLGGCGMRWAAKSGNKTFHT